MKLYIPIEIWQKMRGFCLAAMPNEITGLGTIKLTKNDHGDFLTVDQIFVPRQSVDPIYCESDKGAINEIIFGFTEDNPARAGDLRFRWHSHAGGSVFWSATDEKDINAWTGPWCVNLVMNVLDDYLARFDLFSGIRVPNLALDVRLVTTVPINVMAECKKEIRQKVTPIPFDVYRTQVKNSKKLTDYHDYVAGAPHETKLGAQKGGGIHETERLF